MLRAPSLPLLSCALSCALALPACGDNLGVDPALAPAVAILAPADGELIGASPAQVRVRITDDGALARATLEAASVAIEIDPAALDAAGEVTLDVPLPAGPQKLRLSAEDEGHRRAVAGVGVVVDLEAPAIALLAPRAGTAETRRLLYAEIADAGGIAAVSYAVNSGAPHDVPVTGAPAQLVVREALPLVAGPNRLAITTTDRAGHTRTETIDLRYGLATTAGGAHSGAIEAGALQTWGRYNVGQLGLGGPLGDAQSRLSPERVPSFGAAGTQVAAISFNQNSSLALRTDGTAWTWGANTNGQLGHGDVVQRSVPAQVTALGDIVYAALGYSHALALRADGAVLAWGKNASGQAGVEAVADQLAPAVVTGLPAPVVELAAGSEHSVALTVDGRVFVWGRNTYGNLGAGAADNSRHPAPTAVPGLTDVIDIATGRDHVLALRADGTVVAWGLGASGQLGYGANADPAGDDRASPVPVVVDAGGARLAGVRAVLANGNSSYAIIDRGGGGGGGGSSGALQYWGWGQNFSGQLATGETSAEERLARRAVVYTPGGAPVFLDEVAQLASVGVGATHTIARTTAGGMFSWGWNFRGTLGVPTIANAWPQTVAVEVTLAP
jgi:alpha-tubulin suppressor-like RCC1 family protein